MSQGFHHRRAAILIITEALMLIHSQAMECRTVPLMHMAEFMKSQAKNLLSNQEMQAAGGLPTKETIIMITEKSQNLVLSPAGAAMLQLLKKLRAARLQFRSRTGEEDISTTYSNPYSKFYQTFYGYIYASDSVIEAEEEPVYSYTLEIPDYIEAPVNPFAEDGLTIESEPQLLMNSHMITNAVI